MKKITNLTEAFDSLKTMDKPKTLKEGRKTLGSRNRNPKEFAIDLCVTAINAIEKLWELNGEDYIDLSDVISSEESQTLNKAIEILDRIGYDIEIRLDEPDYYDESLKEDLNPNTIHDYIDNSVSMEDLGLMAYKWLPSDELVAMLEANGYKDASEFEESLKGNGKKKSLKEARWSYTLKSGSELRSAIDNEDPMGVIFALQNAYAELRDAGIIDEYDFDSYTGDFELYEEDDDDIEETANYELDNFYDLCDALKVWIPLD